MLLDDKKIGETSGHSAVLRIKVSFMSKFKKILENMYFFLVEILHVYHANEAHAPIHDVTHACKFIIVVISLFGIPRR